MHFFIPTAATGNSRSLATIGRSGEIMGFFYPRIDFAQNIREAMPAVRRADTGEFLWCFSDVWDVTQSMGRGSNIVVTRARHRNLDMTLEYTDVLPADEQALFRRVVLTKGPSVPAMQFVHYFKLVPGDAVTRSAVQYFAKENVVVQHYRDVALGVSASTPFAAQCGGYSADGRSPTKEAIENGQYGSSTQAIGRVDFAIGFEPVDTTRWETVIVLAGAPDIIAARQVPGMLLTRGFDAVVQSANHRVQGILSDAGGSPIPELAEPFERAVIALNDLYDETEGTFIAAPEFDPGYELSGGYGYCWPRDAAVCALAMQHIGRSDRTTRFFEWASRAQLPDGHWYQRSWTDGSAAPSWCVRDGEVQLDQTCALVHSAGLFARRLGRERPAFVKAYRPTVERAMQAICAMIGDNGLHTPAMDLWENSTGSFAYTQAAIIAAMKEADEVFSVLPEQTGAERRGALRQTMLDTFWDAGRRRWIRRVTPEGHRDETQDSSVMGLIDPWGVLDLNDAADRALAIETLDGISADLRSEVKGGGAILRFQNESYMGGGPGCVNTLWLGLCRLRLAATATETSERRTQRKLGMDELAIAIANANPTGQLPELIPKQWFAYWAAPHAWASSLLIEAVMVLRALEPANAKPVHAET